MPVVKKEYERRVDVYENIETVKMQLTLCKECYGCGLLEITTFAGVKECSNYRKTQRGQYAK